MMGQMEGHAYVCAALGIPRQKNKNVILICHVFRIHTDQAHMYSGANEVRRLTYDENSSAMQHQPGMGTQNDFPTCEQARAACTESQRKTSNALTKPSVDAQIHRVAKSQNRPSRNGWAQE